MNEHYAIDVEPSYGLIVLGPVGREDRENLHVVFDF